MLDIQYKTNDVSLDADVFIEIADENESFMKEEDIYERA